MIRQSRTLLYESLRYAPGPCYPRPHQRKPGP